MRRFVLPVLLVVLVLALASPALAERRVALVIGNGAYSERPLKNSVNDAQDMAASLKKLGFETTLLIDATMQQMENAVREFGQKLRQGGMGLFYYAGHGVQVGGNNYLVPVKAVIQSESDVKYGCLDAGLVLGKMDDAHNGLNVIILDACRNNPFARSFSRNTGDQGLAKMDAPTGSLIAYSTSPGKIADDGVGKNGLYTQHLLKNIATPGLSVEELFKRVRQGVAGDSARKQVPWEASSLIGQFSFAGGEHTASLGPAAGVSVAPKLAPAPVLPAAPSGGGVDFGGIEKKGEERAKAEAASKKQWADWLSGMKSATALALALEKKPGVSASDKAEAWVLLASKYTQKDPYTDEDDTLRSRMAAQANYWTTQAGNEAAAQAKTEGARLAAERKRQEDAQRLAHAKADAEAAAPAKKQQQLLALAPVPNQLPPAPLKASVPSSGWTDPVTQMEFVWVPGGSFEMGCGSWTSDCFDWEKPVHTVRLNGFWLGKYEVTQGQWQRVMDDNPSIFKKGDNYPVEQVSWNNVKVFITKLNAQGSAKFRLPTEAEWEYAARSGGKAEKYSGGDDIDRVAWFTSNSGSSTHAMGTKAPNGLGLYDMSGNVWEWCEDVFADYPSFSQDNPVVTGGGSYRVFRGGSWRDGPRVVRAARRSDLSPDGRGGYLGFRLARTN